MRQRPGSQRRLARRIFAVAVADVIFATLSAHGQSRPATQVAICSPDRPAASAGGQTKNAMGEAGTAIQEVRANSFPELARVDLRTRAFRSRSDYFRTRFSFSRFLLLAPMRYFIEVNPAVFEQQAPFDGICAILAHELVHVASLRRGNRIRRLGLVQLLSKRQTAKFERRTDLEAIQRGYGNGLKSYRVWVYAHVPPDKLPEKRRNYFSPEEIAAIQLKLQGQPDIMAYWSKHVPLNLQEIQSSVK